MASLSHVLMLKKRMKPLTKNIKEVHNQNGFTLIELIMIVILLGILSVVAVSKFDSSTHTQLQYKTMINKIAADVRFAQQLAMSAGRGTRVYIDQSNNRYYLTWDDGANIQNPIGSGNFIIQLGQGDFQNVQITSTGFSGGRLDFNTAGNPSNQGASFSGTLNLVTLNTAKKIVVRANTGLLTIQDL